MIAPPAGRVRDKEGARGTPHGLWTVVLAAGGARRYGRSKLVVRAGRDSLLGRAVDAALAVSGSRCVVVLGADASRARAALAGRAARIVVNRHWRYGMSGSLRAGIAALPRSARAALVMLADQYAVGPAELGMLIRAWRHRPGVAVAALVAGHAGAPAILPRRAFPQLRTLQGDQGARALLRSGALPFSGIDLPAAARDLDAPGDLPALRRHAAARLRRPAAWPER